MRHFSISAFFVIVFAISSSSALGQTIYVVGTCRTGVKNFTTISAAVAAAPAGSTVEVCPGTYSEQVKIETPLTLRGVTSSNLGRATIVAPNSGLVANATSIFGDSIFAQLVVDASPVNITDITVSGPIQYLSGTSALVGIFYESGSSGTINQVQVYGQYGNTRGTGIWVEDGNTAQESVTIENSNVGGVDHAAIFFGSNITPSTLTATLTGNEISVSGITGGHSCGPVFGIVAQAAGTIAGNTIFSSYCGAGILASSTTSVKNNTIISSGGGGFGSEEGILLSAISATIESNTFLINTVTGVASGIHLVRGTKATIQSNNFVGGNPAVDFACQPATISNNTISDATIGLANMPSGITSSDAMYNVDSLQTTTCAKPAAASAEEPSSPPAPR